MSYILNALRKSERERQATEPDTIADRIAVHHQPRYRGSIGLIAALLVINVAILVYFLGFSEKSSPAVSAAPEIKAPTSAVSQAALSQKPVNITTSKPTANIPPLPPATDKKPQIQAMKSAGLEKMAEPNKTASTNVQHSNRLELAPQTISTAINNQKAMTEPVAAELVQAEPNTEQAVTMVEALNKPPAAPENTDLPYLDELAYEFQRSLPVLPINVFSYSAVPNERFVMIDMVKYIPGQRIKDLLEFKEIRPDAIVVSYKGRTFKIRRP